MAFNDWYDNLSKDRRLLFVRWLLVLFISTGVGLVYGYTDKKAYDKKFDAYDLKMDSLKEELTGYKIEKIRMQNEIDKLKENQIKFNNLEDQYAQPRILKSLTGEVFSINNAYYFDFMKPYGFIKSDYKNDVQFWGKKTAEKFHTMEALALKERRPLTMHVNIESPFKEGEYIDRDVTVNPLKDRYGVYIAFEVAISKEY